MRADGDQPPGSGIGQNYLMVVFLFLRVLPIATLIAVATSSGIGCLGPCSLTVV